MEVFNLDIDIPKIELTVLPDRSTWWTPPPKPSGTISPPQQHKPQHKTPTYPSSKPQNNPKITPPKKHRLPTSYPQKLKGFITEVLKLKHATNLGKFTPNHNYAKKYAKDYKSILGTLRFEKGFDASDWQDTVKMTKACSRPQLITLFGAPGATKSSGLLKLIKEFGLEKLAMALTVVCPRVEQHSDWMQKLNPIEDFMVKTFETPFRQPVAELVVVEELGQTPGGWLDCLLYTRPHIKYVITLGDFRQNVHYEPNINALTRQLLPTIDRLMVSNTKYLNDSYRLANNQCRHLKINCAVDRPDCKVRASYTCPPDIPILASSDSRATKLTKTGYSNVYTYPGSQGSDFKNKQGKHIPYALQINKDCLSMSERCWFTAITRSNVEIILWIEDERIFNELAIVAHDKPSLQALLDMRMETLKGEERNVLELGGSSALRAMEKLRDPDQVNEACYNLVRHCQVNNVSRRDFPNFYDGIPKKKFERFTSRELEILLHSLNIAACVGYHSQRLHHHTHRLVRNGARYYFQTLQD